MPRYFAIWSNYARIIKILLNRVTCSARKRSRVFRASPNTSNRDLLVMDAIYLLRQRTLNAKYIIYLSYRSLNNNNNNFGTQFRIIIKGV